MPVYKVKNWNDLFETYETKKLRRLTWVPMPNKHDGKSYRRILRLQHGPLVYAAWLLILQVASKCEPRGILADGDGALSALDLADKTGFPEKYFELAFKHLTAKEIGWLESDESAGTPASHPAITASHPENTALKGREGKGIEGKRDSDAADEFKSSWSTLPPPFPQPLKWSGERTTALNARLADKFFCENWKAALERVRESKFCAGVSERGWVMDVDFFLKPNSVAKILEGKYDDRKQPNAPNVWTPKTDLSELPDDIFEPEARQ